jgi:hypothetical protein
MKRRLALIPGRPSHWLLLAAIVACPACSGGRHPVRGKVLIDGNPVKGAVVTFHPKNDSSTGALRPTGLTDENGVFTLSTQNETGALAGEYRVGVIWLSERPATTDKLQQGISESTDQLKGRYADPEKSGLTAVIKSGANELAPFELKKVD